MEAAHYFYNPVKCPLHTDFKLEKGKCDVCYQVAANNCLYQHPDWFIKYGTVRDKFKKEFYEFVEGQVLEIPCITFEYYLEYDGCDVKSSICRQHLQIFMDNRGKLE